MRTTTGSTRARRSSGGRLPDTDRGLVTEVVELTLRGARAKAPASIVEPLLISDLPVFLRWRGEPPWDAPELEQLVGVTDRLIVDSTEWDDLPGRVPAAGGALSALRRLGHRLGANVALALAPRDAVAGDRGGADRARPRDGGAGVAPVRLAALAARPGRDRARARTGGEARGRGARRRSRCRFLPATRRRRATSSPTSSSASRRIRSTRPPCSPPPLQARRRDTAANRSL